ncbi:1,4-dihydroxy-2-naphthoate prenyltransferase [Polaribacter sp. ALD11]|uniref:1,4-dihydroxy-2-naphthoate prenyltransferase n=1 Tax=Polaribacter sp. ALD11 TaxID=2058137 RepID=UPI000C3194C5|nr:1,4-dihydroxy-2-naphthoate prenyltransferase [Polaribacter sp. ALD11]AUC86532.1 1,4-dihydroxy-2-naphthoate prenyltransferase [Polaribacter sp. ALD11]
MKTIKVILIIISVLVLAFLTTGLVIKETSYSATVSIEKPVNEVFNNFMKIDSVKNWIPEIQSVKATNKNPGMIGSIYNVVVLNQGEEIKMTEKIMAYVPNEKVTLFFDAENMLKKDDYLFSEENGITTITLNASCQSESFIMACMFPYFKGTFQKQDQSYLNNFKNYIENK